MNKLEALLEAAKVSELLGKKEEKKNKKEEGGIP